MKSLFLLLLVLPVAAESDNARLLRAIAEVETGNRPRLGKSGERGAHQMMPSTRFRSPEDHLNWLAEHLARAGLPVTPYTLALSWNAGLERTIQHRTLSRQQDYAERVTRLFYAETIHP